MRGMVLGFAAAALTACASTPPDAAIGSAERAVQRAEDAGARRYAPGDLSRAREHLKDAQAAAGAKADWVEARRSAEKAVVDSEVAAARAANEQLRVSVEELQRSVPEAGLEAGP